MVQQPNVKSAIREVFRNGRYVVIAIALSAILFVLAVYLPNLRLVASFIGNPTIPLSTKSGLLWALLEGIGTSITPFSATIIIVLSVLFGIDLAMLAYQWSSGRAAISKSGLVGNAGGVISGIFGMGCAACGSFLGTALLASFGASGVIALLPLRGGEFSIIGIALLLLSIWSVSRAIRNNGVCAIE